MGVNFCWHKRIDLLVECHLAISHGCIADAVWASSNAGYQYRESGYGTPDQLARLGQSFGGFSQVLVRGVDVVGLNPLNGVTEIVRYFTRGSVPGYNPSNF